MRSPRLALVGAVVLGILVVMPPAAAGTNPFLSLTWTRVGSEPVVPAGPVGSWDHYGVIAGSVLYVDGTYHLFYTGNDGTSWGLGHATSPDGIRWTKDPKNPAFWNAQSSVVLYENGLFKMWYVNVSGPAYAIDYATSVDGTAWDQSLANPVLTVSPSGWDSSLITTGAILHDASGYRLWYTGTADHATFAGGLATSPDGVHWTKYAGNPVLSPGSLGAWTAGFVTPCDVFSNGTSLALWYVGGPAGAWQVGVAVSPDGINWTAGDQPVLSADATSWDSNQISRVSVLRVQDTLWMWYTGMGGGTQQVGLAEAPYPSASSSPPPGVTQHIAIGPALNGLAIVGITAAGGLAAGGMALLGERLRKPRRPY